MMSYFLSTDFWKPENLTLISTIANAIAAIASAIVAFFSSIVAIIAVILSYKTIKTQELTTSATLMTGFTTLYDSIEMKKRRRTFASRLLDEDNRDNFDLGNSESVLEFFEEIAYLTRRKVLDKGMVWNHFFWHIERYYQAVTKPTNLIEKTRNSYDSSTIFQEFEWLFKELCEFDRTQESKWAEYTAPKDDDIKKHLEYETQLSIETDSATFPEKTTKGRKSPAKK